MREMIIVLRAPSLAEAIREGLAKKGLTRMAEHFEKWAQPNAEGALTVTREAYDRGLSLLLAGQTVDPKAKAHLFDSLDTADGEAEGTVELERLDLAIGLVKKKPPPKVEPKVEVFDVRAMREELRQDLWGDSSSYYDSRGRIIVPDDSAKENEKKDFMADLQLIRRKPPANRWSPAEAARRIEVLSKPSRPPRVGRRDSPIIHPPPKPPKLAQSKLLQLSFSRPSTSGQGSAGLAGTIRSPISPRLLAASAASLRASASLPRVASATTTRDHLIRIQDLERRSRPVSPSRRLRPFSAYDRYGYIE